MTEQRATRGLIAWTLAALRPFRSSVALLAVLLVAEIGLGALQPWPLAIVINLLSGQPMPELVAPVIARIPAGHTFALLIVIVISGVVLQVINQFVSAYGTQVQVETGQRMVYDLRERLFEHLTALGLHHHLTTSTADTVYRVDVDAYSIENLIMSGLFPLATAICALTVMFGVLLRMNATIALL
ncbi:MAG TPA: ABC transporter transmembrane domain-containing protein, partial [Vicinamibacterales bacterium]|nr:ABC transporter transmembrane domain-containing protein [Vicinamibacterales bacterium]